MIQEGGISPLLGRFKGDRKGGAPARIQRSDSRGKRRNNETDETCRLRQGEGCEVCSDANSPFAVFFLPPAAFSLPRKEKGAETPLAHFVREKPPASSGYGPSAPLTRLAPSGRKKRHPFRGDKPRVLRARLAPAGAKNCPPFGGQNHLLFLRCGSASSGISRIYVSPTLMIRVPPYSYSRRSPCP